MNDLAELITQDAWSPDVLQALAALSPSSAEFQKLLDVAKGRGVRLRDWRSAIAKLRDDRARRPDRGTGLEEEAPEIASVRAKLLLSEENEIRRCTANVTTILVRDPRWAGRLAYHVMREAPVIVRPIEWHEDDAPAEPYVGPWTDADSIRTSSWLSRCWDLDVPAKMVSEAIEAVSRKAVVDPVRDYLRSLRWDGIQRLPSFLPYYFGSPKNEYTAAVGTRWMISAVARALVPGCKVDCVLVLEARQGTGKSAGLRALCPFEELFADDELALGNKDAPQNLSGKWIYELGELDKMSRHELGTLKAFVTRQTDTYRPTFGIRSRDFPRHTVFAGTVNPGDYLRDDENRRYWPVLAPSVAVKQIEADRDQLWAEAVARFDSGEAWHVDTPELAALCRAEQDQRRRIDPWSQWIGDWCARRLSEPCTGRLDDRCRCVRCQGVTTSEVLQDAVQVSRERQGTSEEMRVAGILRGLGWDKGAQERRAGGRVRPFFPPKEPVAEAEYPSAAE